MNTPVWLQSLLRAVRWHRRGLGMLAAAVCLVAALAALNPGAGDVHTVVVTSGALQAGTTIDADDITTIQVPGELAVEGTLSGPAEAIGQVVVTPRPAGAILTTSDFLGKDLVSGSDGLSLVPFRIADPGVVGVLRVGDEISVVAASSGGGSETIATAVRIAALPVSGSSSSLGGDSSGDGALVIVAAEPDTAEALAAASAQYTLSVVLLSS